MADFEIIFKENQFIFNDLTEYSGLTVSQTELVVNYPNLTETEEISLILYDDRIDTLGLSFTFLTEDEAELETFVDGVYKFQFKLYNGSTVFETVTKYYNYRFAKIFQYLLTESDVIMDLQCDAKWTKLGEITAMLDLADQQSQNDRYLEASEIFDYINSIVNDSQ